MRCFVRRAVEPQPSPAADTVNMYAIRVWMLPKVRDVPPRSSFCGGRVCGNGGSRRNALLYKSVETVYRSNVHGRPDRGGNAYQQQEQYLHPPSPHCIVGQHVAGLFCSVPPSRVSSNLHARSAGARGQRRRSTGGPLTSSSPTRTPGLDGPPPPSPRAEPDRCPECVVSGGPSFAPTGPPGLVSRRLGSSSTSSVIQTKTSESKKPMRER